MDSHLGSVGKVQRGKLPLTLMKYRQKSVDLVNIPCVGKLRTPSGKADWENDMFTHLLFLYVTTAYLETVGDETDSSVNTVIKYSNPAQWEGMYFLKQ